MLSLLTVSPSSHAAPLNRLHSGVKAPSHGQLPSVSCSPKPRRTPNVLGAETPEFGPALEGLREEPVGPRADRPDRALSPATFASRRVSPFTAGRVGDRARPSSPLRRETAVCAHGPQLACPRPASATVSYGRTAARWLQMVRGRRLTTRGHTRGTYWSPRSGRQEISQEM